MKTSLCKGCDKPIVWGVTEEGKKIPLDPRPAVYDVIKSDEAKGEVRAFRSRGAMVTHFATCPKASDF